MQKSNKRSDFLPIEVERLVSVIDFLDFLSEGSHFLPPDSRVSCIKITQICHKKYIRLDHYNSGISSLSFFKCTQKTLLTPIRDVKRFLFKCSFFFLFSTAYCCFMHNVRASVCSQDILKTLSNLSLNILINYVLIKKCVTMRYFPTKICIFGESVLNSSYVYDKIKISTQVLAG